ncbi:MAG TPA: Calx-beta domain-containing protein, partial [Candidatus Eisenbacteria bacterium]|nr:Calx-beta domain-containing protein [Candidatus Eisenbacteria bacterium]
MKFAAAAVVVATLAGPHIAAAQVAPAVADPEALRSVGPRESGLENDYFDRLTRGRLDATAQRAMWESARAMPAEPASVSAVNTWQLVGPIYATNPGGGRVTGRVRDIDAHNVRALGSSGGLWRFSFGAVAMSDSVPATWFGSFATSPSDPNTILLGTGEYKSGSGLGLFRTTDGGVTWSPATMPATPNAFTRIRYSPDGSVAHAASDIGYFRSVDGGVTWTRKLTGVMTDVCVVAANPSIVFATISNQGLWRSNDAGQTWAQVAGAGLPTSGTGDAAVTAIVNGPALWIYVVFETAVYRSTDGGVSWTNVSPSYTVSDNFMGPVISVCPTDPNTVLMGNVALNRTTDGGATWAKIITPHLHADFHALAWDDNGVGVWAGEDGGWSHSTDKGLDWDSTDNVMPITQFYSVDCEKTEVGYMLGGTQDNNVLFTPTEALFWTDPVLGSSEGDAYGVTLNQYTPSQMWGSAGLAPGAYAFPHFRSLDGGASWQPHDVGIPPNSYAASLRTDNAFPVHVFTSVASYVYESVDSGATWVQSNPTPIPYAVENLTVSQRVSGGAVLYATTPIQTAGQRLYVRDNGVWYERSSSLPDNEEVWKVVPHPWAADANEAWAILHDFTTSHLYHTTDRGLTWTSVTGDFPPNIPITDVVPNPHASNELYVGTYLGCWRSLNGGANWERWTNGMPPTVKVSEMTYIDQTASGGPFSIVAATYGRSVWKRDIIGSDPQPSLSVGNASCVEGNAGTAVMEFPVTLSAPQGMPVYVGYATANGTAVAGSDYQSASGTAMIPAGYTTTYVSVLVNGDTAIEPDETFTLTLSNPVRATIASGTATGTIEDDDARALVDRSVPIVDGTVNALVLSGDSLFVGGTFSHIGPATGGAVPFDSTTGQPVWLPQVAGSVQAVAADGQGGWYLGGLFTAVGGVPRQNLAHVLADHTVSGWNPAPNGIVFALVVSNGVLYVGGGFTMMGAITRNDLAAFDLAGNMSTWDPEADGTVVSLAIGSSVLYAGGDFTHVGGQARSRLAALNLATGAATAWNPGANDEVASLALAAGTLYVGGNFDTLATQVRHKLAAVDATTGALAAWNPGADAQVLALVPYGATVFVGGAFSTIGNVARPYLAALDAASGAVTGWNPSADLPVFALARSGATLYAAGDFLNVGGQPRGHLAALDVTTALATPWDPETNAPAVALALQGGAVMAGGAFSIVAPQTRNNLAAISVSTGAVLGWNPGTDGTVNALALSGHTLYAGGTFGNLGGQPRARIGSVDAGTGLATSFNPGASARVWTLLPIGTSIVLAGGQFTTIGGVARNAIAALSTSSGAATSWNPNANGIVAALATDGTYVYAGGSFTGIGGAARNGLAALNTSTGAAISTWNPAPNGATTSLQEVSGSLVVTGAFTNIAGVGRGRAAILNSNGTVSSWNPGADGVIDAWAISGATTYVGGGFNDLGGTVPRHHLGGLTLSNSVTNWPPEPNNTVNALVTVGNVVWAGGSFTAVAGLPQAHLAR